MALNGGRNYAAQVEVLAGTLPNDPVPPNSGMYKVAVALLHRDIFGVVTNVAAVLEIPNLVRIA